MEALFNKLAVPLPVFLLTCCAWVLLAPWVFALGVLVVMIFALITWADPACVNLREPTARFIYAVLWGAALAVSCTVAGIEHDAIQRCITKDAGL